jgi:hypothetical protein
MAATISTEGTDSWEAVSRSYSYVFQKPWHFAWYTLVSLLYGAVVIFFIGFLGSFAVYLSKWGVSKTPLVERIDRDPARLFVYAPTSFGWRTLLLDGAHTKEGKPLVTNGVIDPVAYNTYLNGANESAWWNKVGAAMVAFWVGLVFLLVLGVGYSFFWSAATIVYLLMRKAVDGADLDEVYLEDEDETPFSPPVPQAGAPPTKPGLTMVEAPSMRPVVPPTPYVPPPAPPVAPPPPPAPVTTAPSGTDTHPPYNAPAPDVNPPPPPPAPEG